MVALYLHAVEGTRIATDEQTTREVHPGKRVQPAFGDGPGTVDDTRAALQIFDCFRVVLPALELLERAHMGIAVVQIGDQADIDLVVLGVIHESAAAAAGFLQGPAQAVYHQAFLVLFRGYFPDFLNTDAVVLRILVRVQRKPADQLLAQVAATTFREQRVPGVQLHARHVAVLVFAIGAYTHIAGCNTFDPTVVMIENFSCGKSRVNLHPQPLCLLRQPAADVTHGDNVVAFVMRGLGNQEVG